jgi:hypothetical protein
MSHICQHRPPGWPLRDCRRRKPHSRECGLATGRSPSRSPLVWLKLEGTDVAGRAHGTHFHRPGHTALVKPQGAIDGGDGIDRRAIRKRGVGVGSGVGVAAAVQMGRGARQRLMRPTTPRVKRTLVKAPLDRPLKGFPLHEDPHGARQPLTSRRPTPRRATSDRSGSVPQPVAGRPPPYLCPTGGSGSSPSETRRTSPHPFAQPASP